MAEVVLFHHVQGLTDGMKAFADEVRSAGHTVHTPDLFEGRTFDTLDDGMAFVRESGGATFDSRADDAVASLPESLVFAGFSFGGGQAQRLAQTRPGAAGALLFETCYPITGEWAFGPWPDGVPVQVHGMDADPFFAEEGADLDAAKELVEKVEEAELFTYSGDKHLFADSSLASYDAVAAALLTKRVLEFLESVDSRRSGSD